MNRSLLHIAKFSVTDSKEPIITSALILRLTVLYDLEYKVLPNFRNVEDFFFFLNVWLRIEEICKAADSQQEAQ